MKQTFTILFIFIIAVSVAQEAIRFNYNYPHEYYYRCNNMQIVNNNFVLIGNINSETSNCASWAQGLHITHIDSIGELQSIGNISRCNWRVYNDYGSFVIDDENNYIIAGMEFSDTSQDNNLFFLRLNSDFDTIISKQYFVDTLSKRCWDMSQCKDGGYILVGGIDSTHSEFYSPDQVQTKILLIRIDQTAVQKWTRSIGFADDVESSNYQYGKKVIETWDKGFIVVGVHHDYNTNTFNSFIMKTDSLGNYKWKKTFSTAPYDTPNIQDLIETKDSCYVVCGAKNYGEVFGGLYPYDGWIYKLDTYGNVKWQKIYREHHPEPADSRDSIYCYFRSICELPDGRIAVTGDARKTPDWDFRRPFLYMLNSEGDSLFTRHYTYFPIGDPNFVNYTYPSKILPTDDGGFAIAGWGIYTEWNEIIGNWEQPERVFLIKTDSLGNDGVVYVHEVNNTTISDFNLNCYPNPASTETFVELPPNINDDILIVYSTSGAIVHEQEVKFGVNRINLCNFKAGMYLMKLKENNLYGKLVVE